MARPERCPMWIMRLLPTSACASRSAHESVSAAAAAFRSERRTLPALRGWRITHLAVIVLAAWLSTTPVLLADRFDSPTNYVPAISDVYVCNSVSGTVLILHGVTGALLRTIYLPQGAKPVGIAFLPNYAGAYVTDGVTGKIYFIWNQRVAKIVSTSSGPNGAIAVHPKGTFAYIETPNAGPILVLDTDTRAPPSIQLSQRSAMFHSRLGLPSLQMEPARTPPLKGTTGFPRKSE